MWSNKKRNNNNAPALTPAPEAQAEAEAEAERMAAELQAKEEAIRRLLTFCSEQHYMIPSEYRVALLGGEEEEDDAAGKADEENYGVVSPSSSEKKSLLDDLIDRRSHDLAQLMDESEIAQEVRKIWTDLRAMKQAFELRIQNGSYTISMPQEEDNNNNDGNNNNNNNNGRAKQKITTVGSVSPLGKLIRMIRNGKVPSLRKKKMAPTVIMDGVNLMFESGKMYLVLGAPGCGKSTLLKMIAGTLREDANHTVGGSVAVNGIVQPNNNNNNNNNNGNGNNGDSTVLWSKIVSYIDQIDRLHARMTVKETCDFAWKCRHGGTHMKAFFQEDDDNDNIDAAAAAGGSTNILNIVQQLDEQGWAVNTVLKGLGLARVSDTFVGDNSNVRGVSGGERKRVTVAEIMCLGCPILCADEISTGLDAATTYDITKLMGEIGRILGKVQIVSLLQPPPETVALFDELILLDQGRVIYAGPVQEVVPYFENLGYKIPDRMDTADWLQSLPNRDGAQFLADPQNGKHLTRDEFVTRFKNSEKGTALVSEVEEPSNEKKLTKLEEFSDYTTKYKNSWFGSSKIVTAREVLLWARDTYKLRAAIGRGLIMGIVAGTLFWQQSDDPQSVMGILFQSLFLISLGAMQKVPDQIDERGTFYKHQDANLFPTSSYVFGRSVAIIPSTLIDTFLYGTIIYWFVGLAFNDGASIANFFIFLLCMLVSSFACGLLFGIMSTSIRDKSTAQAVMSVALVLLILFSGFTVQPDVIPNYWIWVYWLNIFGWMLRALVVNEYQSGKYDDPAFPGAPVTTGEAILLRFGFTDGNDEPFDTGWIWYGMLYSLGLGMVALVVSVLCLQFIRYETGKSLAIVGVPDATDDDEEEEEEEVVLSFQRVNLTFSDIRYSVKASTKDETLELLKGIDGFIEAGKMTALMGSSGAGKTTLMDVLSLRKSSGKVTGEVRLNGHLQEPNSFRRCTGYVEQFDVQSPGLTIRETVDFSARLRLDENDPAVTPENTDKFVDQILNMLELEYIQDLLVGSDETGGLSFEQRKRLSIAVELVANPSVIFLDEPTSGLDARAASLVMRGLKRIASTGRAVCATIHQPSISIFNSFDSLLLLKKGGETVFFGDLGDESANLIQYFEGYEATTKIQPGENPATWMLTTIGAGSASSRSFDYATSYSNSALKKQCIEKIDEFTKSATDDNLISYKSQFATQGGTQAKHVVRRIIKIYWRSPSYNVTRVAVSIVVAMLFGSVFSSQRVPEDEGDMNSRVTSVFMTFLFLGVMAFNTVLDVFETERNMFYRHKASLMYEAKALGLAFFLAEIPFILLSSAAFCFPFYFMVGFSNDVDKVFWYYLFFTLNVGLWTFFGQMAVSLFRDSVTAQGIGQVLIGLTSLFSGLLIRPGNIATFWTFAYWLLPGHYILEGLLVTQFRGDDSSIIAFVGSPFYDFNCPDGPPPGKECTGTAEDWITTSFTDFKYDNVVWDAVYLICAVFVIRVITLVALVKLNFLQK